LKNFFNKIIYTETTESTNTFLKENDFEDKTILYTFNQTKGRGRENRNWINFSNKDLALSIGLKPQVVFQQNVWYISLISLSLIDVFKKLKIKNSWIKWPNDVYIENKKIAGILSESIWKNNSLSKFIIGIGININSCENDLKMITDKKTTSIFLETGKEVHLNDFVKMFIDSLSKWFLLFEKNKIERIKKEWIKYCNIINKKVEWKSNEKKTIGIISDIDKDGFLYLKTENETIKIICGEISIL
jgi:BirA family transcriptional regulator, biotin operon repressor / biotin---[acetyl-CoA-carboxylase] ligase